MIRAGPATGKDLSVPIAHRADSCNHLCVNTPENVTSQGDAAPGSGDPRVTAVRAGWQAACCGMVASVPAHSRDCRYREQEQAR